MKEKYKREVVSMLGELSKKATRLQKQVGGTPILSVNTLNKAQELTSLVSDIERAIYITLSAEKELRLVRISKKELKK